MKKFFKGLAFGIAAVMLALTMLFAACTKTDPTTDSSYSDSTGTSSTESKDTDSSTENSSQEDSSVSEEVTVMGVTLSYSVLNLNTGDSSAISAAVTTSDGSDYTDSITWATSAETVAAVTGSGTSATISALTAGTATITAEAGGISATCTVTVTTLTIDGLESAGAYSESIYATWDATNVANTTAYYKASASTD